MPVPAITAVAFVLQKYHDKNAKAAPSVASSPASKNREQAYTDAS